MCERFLHCPYCNRRLVALCTIAGDNATGLYLEFYLVKPVGTELSAFVPSQTGLSTDAEPASRGITTATVRDAALEVGLAGVGAHASEERGWDDDEAPFPPK